MPTRKLPILNALGPVTVTWDMLGTPDTYRWRVLKMNTAWKNGKPRCASRVNIGAGEPRGRSNCCSS